MRGVGSRQIRDMSWIEIPGRQNISAVTDTPEHAVSTQKAEARFTGGGALQHQHGGKGSDLHSVP